MKSDVAGRSRAIAIALALALAGCVRAGFAVHDGWGPGGEAADGRSGERSAHDRAGSAGDLAGDWPRAAKAVTKANDTCASPASIDLQPLAAGGTVTFTVDTAGANPDYSALDCGGADVVAQLLSAPSLVFWGCAGGGQLAIAYSFLPAPCGAALGSSSSKFCTGGWSSINFNHSAPYVLFCRDPQLGPATIIMRR